MEKNSNSFVKNCFENGMMLSAADLTNLQNYFDGKRRIGYKGLIGYGIAFGLTVEASTNNITVNPGLAVDTQGLEIYVPSALSISVNSLFPNGTKSGKHFLYIEYDEEFCGEAFLISEKKLREPVHNRIRETFRLTAGSSWESEKICIASIVLEAYDDIVQISSIEPSPAPFHLAAMWKGILPRRKSGMIYIDKDDLPDKDGIFRTNEIPHGLGAGKNVTIELSVKSYDKWRECQIFGDSVLFESPVKVAAKLFPESGTFIIAIKPSVSMMLPVCVRWHAHIAQEDDAHV